MKRLEQDIKNGADLTPYLSRGIMDCRHDDLMLYDWGIYHLHVSDEFDTKKADGFMKRSNLLLYALFYENTAYFIRTVVHNGDKFMWTKEEWLNIIYENWPYLLDKYKLTNISADKLTDEERKILRSKHINSIVTLKNGITIMPPNLGYACDGTSLRVVMKSDRLKRWLRGIQNYIIQNIKDLLVKICVCGTSYPKVYQIKLLQINGGSLTLEINNHFLINLQTFNTKRINDKGD